MLRLECLCQKPLKHLLLFIREGVSRPDIEAIFSLDILYSRQNRLPDSR